MGKRKYRRPDNGRAEQLNLFGVPDIQETTCQVPCSTHSIFDALGKKEVTQSQAWLYLVMNLKSDWDSGLTHAQSIKEMTEDSGLGKSTVIANIAHLIEKGWMTKNQRNLQENHHQNVANTYQLTHHLCPPEQAPLDKKGRPKSCAIPQKQGSVFQLVKEKRLTWKAALYWIVNKVANPTSDWQDGSFTTTIEKDKQRIPMQTATICKIRRKLEHLGLLIKQSQPFQALQGFLCPKPYETRRPRKPPKLQKRMRDDGTWWYAYNERWRINPLTGTIETKEKGFQGKIFWRHANLFELENANRKIFNAFKPILDSVLTVRKLRAT